MHHKPVLLGGDRSRAWLGSRLGHHRMPSTSSEASDSANCWEIHLSRVVIDRLPDGQLHKLRSGMEQCLAGSQHGQCS